MSRATFSRGAAYDPALWSVDAPNLYSAIVTVESDGKPRDAERVTFGVRTVRFDADNGFFLNGQPLKIQGTCNHQDHAGVGAAVPDRLQAFRLGVLKQMGCNAVRTSHNMPTPELVAGLRPHGHDDDVRDAADELEPRGHGAARDHDQALPQLAVHHSLVDRQRGVAPAERHGRAGRKDRRDHGAALPRARPHARGLRRGERRQLQGRLGSARHHRLQLQSEVSRRLSQDSIPRGRSSDRRRRARLLRAACTRPIRCATP